MRKPVMLMFTLSLLSSLCIGLVGPIYPIYVLKRFSATIVDTGILYAIFCAVAAAFKAPIGKIADKYGKVKVYLAGVVLGIACMLLYIFASHVTQLYIIEFFSGLSYALERPALLALMADLTTRKNSGFLMGLFDSAYDLAEAAAAVLSVAIVSQFGFEALFGMCSCFEALSGILAIKSRGKIRWR